MEIIGSVSPQEVPVTGHNAVGLWTRLAMQVIGAHEQGRVLVIKATDRDEAKRMVNGMSEKLRQAGYSRSFTSVDEPDGSVRVFCQLIDKKPTSVVVKPIGRRKRAAR